MTERDLATKHEQLKFDLDDQPTTLIYVASALTSINMDERTEISRRCEIIDQTIVETSRALGYSWQVHLPVLWTAPKPDDDRSPREIYDLNRDHVRRASGLILLGDHGGSLGAGQEFDWALSRRMPVLVILGSGFTLSRQIAGTPALMCVRHAATDEQLRQVVATWVKEWGPSVESRSQNWTGERVLADRVARHFNDALPDSSDSIEVVAALSGLNRERVLELFTPEAILDASVSEVNALSQALGLELGDVLKPDPISELSSGQRRDLATAAKIHSWTPKQILRVELRARLELTRDATNRAPLESVHDLVAFANNLDLYELAS